MTYDGEGHRTKVVETPAAGSPVTTRDFRYQGDAVVEELVDGVTVRTIVVDEAGSPVKVTLANSGSANGTYLPTWNGHGDLLALWRLEADGTLTLANTVTYDTWGRPTLTAQNGIADLGFRRLYVGRSDVWSDDAYGAGLLSMHARSYVPALGRFLQPDPVAAEGNLYAYAENSPVTKADPSGELGPIAIPMAACLADFPTCVALVAAGAYVVGQAANSLWKGIPRLRLSLPCLWKCETAATPVARNQPDPRLVQWIRFLNRFKYADTIGSRPPVRMPDWCQQSSATRQLCRGFFVALGTVVTYYYMNPPDRRQGR